MSAWIVSRTHIDHMVTEIVKRLGTGEANADEIGRVLWQENLRSVAARYGDGVHTGGRCFHDDDADSYTWTPKPLLSDGGVAKTIGCYDYQSCEHPEYETSQAKRWVDAVQQSVGDVEYDDNVPWGWDDPE